MLAAAVGLPGEVRDVDAEGLDPAPDVRLGAAGLPELEVAYGPGDAVGGVDRLLQEVPGVDASPGAEVRGVDGELGQLAPQVLAAVLVRLLAQRDEHLVERCGGRGLLREQVTGVLGRHGAPPSGSCVPVPRVCERVRGRSVTGVAPEG